MDLSSYPVLRDLHQRGLVKELNVTVPRGENVLRRGREEEAMRWLGLDAAMPARRRSEAIRRAVRDALLSGRTLPAELFNARLQLVAAFKEGAGVAEAWFVPKSTDSVSEVH